MQTRPDKSFIDLSCSDITIGSFILTVVSIPLLKWDVSAFDHTHRFIWIFSACFPYVVAWILVVIYCIRQSYYRNKRANLQTIYHYENILNNNILPAFHFGNSNFAYNKTHYSLHIIIPLCSIKVEGDSKQNTR